MSKKRKVQVVDSCEHGSTVVDEEGNLSRLTPLPEGTDLTGRCAVNVERNEDGTYSVETLHDGRAQEAPVAQASSGRSGPAYYATDASRASWDRMFGKKKSDAKAN